MGSPPKIKRCPGFMPALFVPPRAFLQREEPAHPPPISKVILEQDKPKPRCLIPQRQIDQWPWKEWLSLGGVLDQSPHCHGEPIDVPLLLTSSTGRSLTISSDSYRIKALLYLAIVVCA